MSRNFPVTGLEGVLDALSQLGQRIETQAIRSGLTAAAGVVRDEARLRAPHGKTGKLAKSIRSGSPRKRQDGTYAITVGPKDGKGAANDHAFLGLFFEFGVAPHIIRAGQAELGMSVRTANKYNRVTGAFNTPTQASGRASLRIGGKWVGEAVFHPGIAARPFLRPALDTKAEAAVLAFREKIEAVVEKKVAGILQPMDEAA